MATRLGDLLDQLATLPDPATRNAADAIAGALDQLTDADTRLVLLWAQHRYTDRLVTLDEWGTGPHLIDPNLGP